MRLTGMGEVLSVGQPEATDRDMDSNGMRCCQSEATHVETKGMGWYLYGGKDAQETQGMVWHVGEVQCPIRDRHECGREGEGRGGEEVSPPRRTTANACMYMRIFTSSLKAADFESPFQQHMKSLNIARGARTGARRRQDLLGSSDLREGTSCRHLPQKWKTVLTGVKFPVVPSGRHLATSVVQRPSCNVTLNTCRHQARFHPRLSSHRFVQGHPKRRVFCLVLAKGRAVAVWCHLIGLQNETESAQHETKRKTLKTRIAAIACIDYRG